MHYYKHSFCICTKKRYIHSKCTSTKLPIMHNANLPFANSEAPKTCFLLEKVSFGMKFTFQCHCITNFRNSPHSESTLTQKERHFILCNILYLSYILLYLYTRPSVIVLHQIKRSIFVVVVQNLVKILFRDQKIGDEK
jgi:hypothetical protein